jgi:Rrf2 family protein
MKLSRTVAYAIQAALQLSDADPNKPVPCSQLAANGHMPERFLLQILRNLVTHGILQSTRGVDGGYSLERPPEKTSLLEVIEAIEGPVRLALPSHEGLPESAYAKLSQALGDVTTSTRRALGDIKLSDLRDQPRNTPSSNGHAAAIRATGNPPTGGQMEHAQSDSHQIPMNGSVV